MPFKTPEARRAYRRTHREQQRAYARREEPTSYVYILGDPTDGAIRYVGTTRNSPARRLHWHTAHARQSGTSATSKMRAWIMSLLDAGNSPVIAVVQRVSHCDARKAEAWMIQHYLNAGAQLLNKQHTKILWRDNND
jgi:hypothetical protein